jgi:methyltransferase (TIGR00027 family)
MALFRALESALPADRRLFDDPLAVAFLRPRLRLVAWLSRARAVGGLVRGFIDRRWPGARSSGVARTRFIDDVAQSALRSGIEQVVLLGAGFDARPYRIAAMAGATVFEVDHPATLSSKHRVLEAALAPIPAHVRFVALDFDRQPLRDAMIEAGYDAARRTLVVWEGVTNYLTEAAVDATLGWCASSAPGSQLVFTYVDRRVIEQPHSFEGTSKLRATLEAAGERWTFGLDPSRVADFLAKRNLVLDRDLGAAEYRALYFGRAARLMRGYEFYRIAVAHVPDASA